MHFSWNVRRFCHIDVPNLYSCFCSMKEACTREVEDLVFGILALTCQVCMSYPLSSIVFEALPMHVCSLLECVISPPKS